MTAPQVTVSFSSQVEALRAQDAERTRREERMQRTLELLEGAMPVAGTDAQVFARWVNAAASYGLGRDAAA